MKKVLICLLLLSTGIQAQEVTIPEPEFEGEIAYAANDGTSKTLEFQTASTKTKASTGLMLTGIGKVKSRISVRGKVSPVIVPAQNKLNFVYNHGNNSTNPKNIISLIRFEKKGKNRVAEIASVSGTTGAQSSGDVDYIPFKAKKYGETSYLVVLSNLEPGHYGFFVGETENNNAHLFSIEGYED